MNDCLTLPTLNRLLNVWLYNKEQFSTAKKKKKENKGGFVCKKNFGGNDILARSFQTRLDLMMMMGGKGIQFLETRDLSG